MELALQVLIGVVAYTTFLLIVIAIRRPRGRRMGASDRGSPPTAASSHATPGSLLLRPFRTFLRLESAGGLVLLAAAALALAWANSPLAPSYIGLWRTPLGIEAGPLAISKPLVLWINDGLMAVFFLVVGLELKREVLVGELSDPKRARLPLAAALGGMLVPAGIYALLNVGGAGAGGWAIPMATDIAFALGVLVLLGSRVPLALKVFVTAVAIVDDLGAVLVIAIFYTELISPPGLVAAAGVLAMLVLLNGVGVRHTWPYALLGVALWMAVLRSGLHATIAGVLLALTVPARRLADTPSYLERARLILRGFAGDLRRGGAEPEPRQRDALHSLEVGARAHETPLSRLEHALHPWVVFLIVPVFALANAGVALGDGVGDMFGSPIGVGVAIGLFVGKPLGIVVFAWVAIRLGLAALPTGVRWMQVWGVSLVCGIGFTMSLFIASLAFVDLELLDTAKVGILAGSLASAAAGVFVLVRARPSTADGPAPKRRPPA